MKFKNIVFLLLGIMIFQMFPCMSVNAYESSDSAAVRLMVALDIMEKDEYADKFWGEIPVTRAEMAKILCKLYDLNATLDSSPRFTDVADDYRAYVETVARNGYMSGTSENEFGSKEYITRVQLVKIYVTMLDGDSFANAIGGYPEGYIAAARRLGLSPSDIGGYDEIATQMDVAEFIYEAMNTDMLQVRGIIGNGVSYETLDGQTFLTEKLDIYRYTAVVKANDATSLGKEDGAHEGMVQIGNSTYRDPKGFCDDFLGCEVVVYEKKLDTDTFGEIIYVEPSTKNRIIEIDNSVNIFKSVTDSAIDYYKGDSIRQIKLSYAVNMIYNGRAIDYDINEISDEIDEMKFIDNNGDDLYDVIILYKYSDYMVDFVDVENEKINLNYGEKTITLEDQVAKIYRNGERINLKDLESSDIISVAVSRGSDSKVYTIKSCQKTVVGSIESISNGSNGYMYVNIGEDEYQISDYYTNLIKKGKIREIEPGDSGTFYLNMMGEIATSKITSASTGVAYLADWGVKNESFGDYKLGLLLFTQEGKLELLMTGEKLIIDGKSMKIADILNSAEYIDKLNKRELVKYTKNKENIRELEFAVNGYSESNFSVDVNADLSKTLKCTRASVLDNKWKMANSTIVFRVPEVPNSIDPGISSVSMDESLYSIVNSPFVEYNHAPRVALYDIQPDNSIGYALWPTTATSIAYNNPLIAVSTVGYALNPEGEAVTFIEGYNENNQKVQLYCREDINLTTMPKVGDVVQYTTDYKGAINKISITNSVDLTIDDYVVTNLISSEATKVLGEVAYVTNNQLSVYLGSYMDGDITPDMIGAIVNNSNRTIVVCDGDKLYPIEFSEIEKGDIIFAAINSSNSTRMLVVYR